LLFLSLTSLRAVDTKDVVGAKDQAVAVAQRHALSYCCTVDKGLRSSLGDDKELKMRVDVKRMMRDTRRKIGETRRGKTKSYAAN
jgi:hypothetical protein